MTLTVNHSTPADGSFSATGATAWNASHTLSGTIDVVNGGTGQTTTTAAINALLPTQATNSGKYLTTDGTNTSWATVSGGGSPGGSTTQVQFNNAGAFGGSANFTWDGTNAQLGATGALRFADTDSSNYVAFKAPTIIGSNVNWTLPATDGLPGDVLSTNGSGILSWVTVTITPTSPTNNTLPIVSGTPTVGQTLSSTSGTWNGYPAPTFAYQWVRGASTNISGATSSTYQLQDADYNTTVKCTVTATNSAGSASATSAATATIAAGVPGAPTSVTATGGNTQATISFTAPAITGGVAITSYTATSSPGGFTATGSASPLTVTGLTNGTAYTFTVTATNSIGTGPASAASNAVVPTNAPTTVEYLVVAGGGGGGQSIAGGGGAGGFRTSASFSVAAATLYPVTVGAGGAGGTNISGDNGNAGSSGSNSVFSTVTSNGGGGGGSYNAAAGVNGGSGGGGNAIDSGTSVAGTGNTPSTSPSQGNNGGTGRVGINPWIGGGGGGASAVGGNATSTNGGNGGAGTASSITGSSVTYAGGGGGGTSATATAAGSGGAGGGGAGGKALAGTAGTPNTGGGGGGQGLINPLTTQNPGSGGSGIVVIAYPDTFTAPVSISGGLTYDQPTRSGYRVYRFTAGTGTITW